MGDVIMDKEDMIKEDDVLEGTTVRADVAASLRNKESPTVENSSQSEKDGMDSLIQDEELSHNPALSFLMNQLVNKLATLGQRQNNYAHVDTQVNIENLNLKIGLDEAAFLLEPPSTALSRTVEDYYRKAQPETSPMVVRIAMDS